MNGLGERIKVAAEKVGGLDQLSLRLTDVSRRTLSDWANDRTEPRASHLQQISRVTGTPIAWLVMDEDELVASGEWRSALIETEAERKTKLWARAAQLGTASNVDPLRDEVVIVHPSPEEDGDNLLADDEDLELTFRAKIAETIRKNGGVRTISRQTGIPRGTLEKYVAESATPSVVRAAKIAAAAGVSLDDLSPVDTDRDRLFYRLPEMMEKLISPDAAQDVNNFTDMVRLPLYHGVAASAGPGLLVSEEHAEGAIAFRKTFLREKGASPDHCSVIRARGDSMMPTIPDGSLLVVDHSQIEISNGYIMVISLGDDVLVKRVRRRLDGLVDLISDNSTYAPETVTQDALQTLQILGRVVYFCRAP